MWSRGMQDRMWRWPEMHSGSWGNDDNVKFSSYLKAKMKTDESAIYNFQWLFSHSYLE